MTAQTFSQKASGGTVPTPYGTGPTPIDTTGYQNYVQKELEKIATSLSTICALLPQAATRAPTKPIENMQRFSKDPWRPVAGQTTDRWVTYVNGAWVYLNSV